ncbi:MAG: AAA family ATPase [Ectothiorhodospiraceae bacterium]|jgi:SpoVK/Ycf46/Vps4 family AAA+-type ATPase
MAANNAHDLEVLLRSRVPLIAAETREEQRLLRLLLDRLPALGRPVFHWSVAEGLRRADLDTPPQTDTDDPTALLRRIRATRSPGIYVLADFHPYLQDPLHVRLLKEIALHHQDAAHSVILVSHSLELPQELRPYGARFHLRLPDRDSLESMVHEIATQWARENGRKVRTDRETLERLVNSLLGLSAADARRLIRTAVYDDGAITGDELPAIQAAKFRLLDRGSGLNFEYDTAGFADVGGLRRLKSWLQQRSTALREPDPNLPAPRGILLVGVQGGGKSLAAKAVAGLWDVPLLRLDMGTLYSKYYGESERNLRNAMQTAEVVAPCVLWIDEIEKALAAGDSDDGLARRLLGTLLTWLAEHREPVFLVATANAIDRLPPELIRKGRMDEIFFVDLPKTDVRAEIFDIHLRRREIDPADFDLQRLAEVTDGFSGAEIEQAVVSALYLARSERSALDQEHLETEIQRTRPLSVLMDRKIAALRAWAAERTVFAD